MFKKIIQRSISNRGVPNLKRLMSTQVVPNLKRLMSTQVVPNLNKFIGTRGVPNLKRLMSTRGVPNLKRSISTQANQRLPKPFGGQIQYISDIHLDYNPFENYVVHPIAPILVIAGDLGNPYSQSFHRFLKENCKNFDQVIFVPGNHEYFYDIKIINEIWNKPAENEFDAGLKDLYEKNKTGFINSLRDMNTTIHKLRTLVYQYPNLQVLDRDRYDLKLTNGKTVKILGCTLWSEIPSEAIQKIENDVADYHRIRKNNAPLSVSYTNMFHRLDSHWLERKLKKIIDSKSVNSGNSNANANNSADDDVLIVTHHAPLIYGTCNPFFLKHDRMSHNNYAYSSDLSNLMSRYKIKAWIHGHTHARLWQHSHYTLVATNALGKVPRNTYQSLRSI